jgi:hypothetical protein
MYTPAPHTHAHTIAVASAATPIFGMRLDDLKWAVSMLVSVFGSLVAIYLFRANARIQAAALARYEALERGRQASRRVVPVRGAGDGRDVTWLDD